MGLFDWLKKKDENINKEINENNEALAEDSNSESENESGESAPSADENVEDNAFKSEEAREGTVFEDNEESIVNTYSEETEEQYEETEEDIQSEEEQENGNEEPSPIFTDTEKEQPQEPPKKQGFFAKIKMGLAKTRNNIMSGVEEVLKSFTQIDEDLYEELEEALIMADIGVDTSVEIIEKLREKVKSDKIKDAALVKPALIEVINTMMNEGENDFVLTPPTVIMVIGVNGVGKTTTIGKLAHNFKEQGKSVMLAAADTFRAAAIDQLEIWGQRNNVPVVKHQENSDPGAVVFDAVRSAKAKNADVLICDTAGRLHNKKNLMDELRKIAKIIEKEYGEAQVETFLVLDATTGQNAVQQAKLFNEAADITGIVLTKLDGTAKGGIVLAIKNEMDIPVRYIGVGEGIDDLQPFNSMEFSRALFDEE